MGPRTAKVTIHSGVIKMATRKNFQWTTELHLGMAEYVLANYDFYKKSLGTQRKMDFLRAMREHLMISANDKQLRNGFQHFLGKYENVKKKLNSSGFGVDPEKDMTLDKGWILKACPYYDILDQVMGTRPNVNPPAVISTSSNFQGDDTSVDQNNSDCELPCDMDESELNRNESTVDTETDINDPLRADQLDDSINSPPCRTEQTSTNALIRDTLKGVNLKKRESLSMKTPLGVFAKVMGDKIEENAKVEREKMQLQVSHFESDQLIQKERNEIERFKIHSQIELEKRRLDIEEQRIAEKKEEREHELKKIKMEQEYELKKMELQLKFKNN